MERLFRERVLLAALLVLVGLVGLAAAATVAIKVVEVAPARAQAQKVRMASKELTAPMGSLARSQSNDESFVAN
ncbi:hypothetical protein [Mesorhizobium sp. WSM3868]|uniref:hypothetical protein n=1 Tax=Mesorhizobium sp. WSM3868 TaxID=2029405 RepID=UPI000BAFCDEF|nr:hypothetical protein [Mesorhizobium sp. WSM3868]PBB39594.1 hypothetical protein CK221_01880 [Mesorhizobium sp. WSM3868]